jgi:uncharacterized membrane protein YuzA (DUF378 family)
LFSSLPCDSTHEGKRKNGWVEHIATLLLIVGGLYWGLVGLANFNLVSAIFGDSIVSRIIYILVGVSALWALWHWMQETGSAAAPPA